MSEKYTPEFYAWAREHGLPPRGPRGSPINKERAKMIPKLFKQYQEELKKRQNG